MLQLQFWTERDGENNMIEEQVGPETTTAEIKKFIPNSKHFVRILAHNSRFNGPFSPLITFDTPEGGNSEYFSVPLCICT